MKRRNISKNRQNSKGNRILQALIAALAIFATAAGIFFLIQAPETESVMQDMKKISFTERNYADTKTDYEIEEIPTEPPGTVTDLIEEEPEQPEEIPEEPEQPEEVPEEPEQAEVIEEEIVDEVDVEDTEIEAPEEDLALMIANAKNYVYTIYTDLEQGSGFLFNSEGDILTNAHVVQDAAYVTVKNSNGQEFNGRVIGVSDTTDIALIRVPEIAGKEPMEMESQGVEVGTPVFALGSPENIINTSTEGEIIGTGKSFFDEYQYDNLYEMTANIKQGSSGGPLISAETGRILGINSIVLTDQPEIGYSIPVYTVREQLENWVANPLPPQEEAVLPDVKEAYFSEEFLRDFLIDFYTLIPYSLNDDEIEYYKFFLLPGSQGEETGKEIVDSLKNDERIFQAVDPEITSIEISEDTATIQANATFTFQDNADNKIVSIKHALVYTIVIDEFGDYQISSIVNQ